MSVENKGMITCVLFNVNKKNSEKSDLFVTFGGEEKKIKTVEAKMPDIGLGCVTIDENIIDDNVDSPYIGIDYTQDIFTVGEGVYSYSIIVPTVLGVYVLKSAIDYYKDWFAMGVVSFELVTRGKEQFFLSNIVEAPLDKPILVDF